MLGVSRHLSFYKRQAVYTEIKLPSNLYTTTHYTYDITAGDPVMRIPTPVSVYVYKGLYVLIFKELLLHYLLYIYYS